ncbi:MAG: hypothetical protein AAF317_11845, partial [Pseudomonadota bacterium]
MNVPEVSRFHSDKTTPLTPQKSEVAGEPWFDHPAPDDHDVRGRAHDDKCDVAPSTRLCIAKISANAGLAGDHEAKFRNRYVDLA